MVIFDSYVKLPEGIWTWWFMYWLYPSIFVGKLSTQSSLPLLTRPCHIWNLMFQTSASHLKLGWLFRSEVVLQTRARVPNCGGDVPTFSDSIPYIHVYPIYSTWLNQALNESWASTFDEGILPLIDHLYCVISCGSWGIGVVHCRIPSQPAESEENWIAEGVSQHLSICRTSHYFKKNIEIWVWVNTY